MMVARLLRQMVESRQFLFGFSVGDARSNQLHRKLRSFCSLPISSKELEGMVRKEHIEFYVKDGEKVGVDAVIQDTLPSGTTLGTVVALHGAPGSHKDFKYITHLLHDKGIRVIGINFPHYGMTPGHHLLNHENFERNSYVTAVIEKLGLPDNLVIMGHSRGCENAIGVTSLIADKTTGLVLVNSPGLRLHRGQRPLWILSAIIWVYNLGPFVQKFMNPLLKLFYNKILGLRLDTGERAILCVRTMRNMEIEGLRPKVEKINEAGRIRVLIAYAGKDALIEPEIPKELGDSFMDHINLECLDRSDEANEKVTKETADLFSKGTKTVSVMFKNDGHFLQKTRAKYLADSVESILKAVKL